MAVNESQWEMSGMEMRSFQNAPPRPAVDELFTLFLSVYLSVLLSFLDGGKGS